MPEFLMKPKIDFAFKEIMSDETVRNGFLSAVLRLDADDIRKTVILNTDLRKIHHDDKQGILDVRVSMNDHTEIDIEIQLSPLSIWADRALFYLAKMYTDQISSGEDYDVLKKYVSISILDFSLFGDSGEFYSCFHIREDTRHTLYTEKMEFHVLELPKLPEELKENSSDLLLWAKFINAERKEEFDMLSEKNASIEKAYERLQTISRDQQKRMEYEAREKAVRDHNQMMKEATRRGLEQGIEQGIKQGIEQGIEQGIKQGIEQGIEQGVEQGVEQGIERGRLEGISIGEKQGAEKRAVEIARKLLASGTEENVVADVTGLSPAQVRALKES